ncbi:threonine/serine exporter [Paenibacillus albiflavus]|uniref:Threonine/serine exporter n=1 Tax=Paenibacillus albiflavus TaxID=2545760 RepID=A0A4R4E8U6_9BACL|nr:threonine/serine exporter family protein [Paenibacillus albiflavus]TCZ75403.1 threonine/serine exporter [Paenibacillus albiflavus]
MMIIEQIVTSFIASAAFGILFNAPKRSLLLCGFIGTVGWIVYVLLGFTSSTTVLSTLTSTFVIGLISLVAAKIYKTPVIIFSVAGIIPLVPGGMAYDAMRRFVENDYNTALQLAAQAFLISGSIAIGLVLSEVLNQMIRKVRTS